MPRSPPLFIHGPPTLHHPNEHDPAHPCPRPARPPLPVCYGAKWNREQVSSGRRSVFSPGPKLTSHFFVTARGRIKGAPPPTTPTTLTSREPATPAPALLGLLLLHVLWQNETESESLVAVEVCISPNQPAVGCVECVECETLFGSSSNYLS